MSLFARLPRLAPVLLVVAASCDGPRSPADPVPAAPSALPETYALATEPTGAADVLAAKKDAADGAEIVVVGRVGGARRVFSDGRAVFTLVDASLKPCGECGKEDGCKTPWDYCCEDVKGLRAATANVEFRDGKDVRRTTARGFHGLDHLKTAVVRGKAERDAAGNLTIVASGVYVRP